MEDNKANVADSTVSNGVISITTDDGRVVSLKTFRDEFEWLRTDFWNLMSRVTQLEEENRKLKEEINEYKYQSTMDRNKVNMLEDIYNDCFSKMKNVSDYVGEMSKDYIRDFVYLHAD